MRLLSRITKKFRKKKRSKKSARTHTPRRSPALESSGGRAGATSARKSAAPQPRKRYKRKTSRIRSFLHWFWARFKRVLIVGVVVLAAFVGFSWLTLPDIGLLGYVEKKRSIVVRAEDGGIIASYGDVYGEYLNYDDIPQSLIHAVLATEDRDFFDHFGIDPWGIGRAAWHNFRAGKVVQGGSTITQQLAKIVFLTPERSLWRKYNEVLLALKLEGNFSKKDILTLYLNRVYLGAGTYGVDAASRRYFNKSARKLTLTESAIIGGLLKAPTRYAPTGNPEAARKRATQVLVNMREAGYLTQAEVDAGKKMLGAILNQRYGYADNNRYFTDWVVDELPSIIGNINEDLEVKTTFLPPLQKKAETAFGAVMNDAASKEGAAQAALIAMSPDGAVRAMLGGKEYGSSQFNRAVQSKRQPGSAFKLFVYLAALERGLTPGSTVYDQPVRIGKWSPGNYTGRFEGAMPLREAVARSINTVAVQLSEAGGRGRVIDMAKRLGVTSRLKPDASIALGSNELSLLELTTAYAHLPSGGRAVHPYGILEIRTSSGKVLYRHTRNSGNQVLDGDIVGMMNDMLMYAVRTGTGKAAQIGRDAAGKTGTTSDYKDAWFVGFTPELVTGVWVGNDAAKSMQKVTGGKYPAQVWKNFTETALAGLPVKRIPTASSRSFASGLWGGDSGTAEDAAPRKNSNISLGKSFWEKLGGGDVKYEYPGSR